MEYVAGLDQVKGQMNQIKTLSLHSLTENLWDLYEKQIKMQLADLIQLSDIAYLEIRSKGQVVASAGTRTSQNVISQTLPMIYTREDEKIPIGELLMIATLERIYQELLDKTLIILISNTVKTFLVSIFMFFTFQHFFIKHLIKISQHLQRITPDNLDTLLTLDGRTHNDELQQLVTNINEMGVKLNETTVSKEALQFNNALLSTQQETSLDGILVVDEQGKIISFNRRFVDMWGFPSDVLESESGGRALQWVLDKLAKPEEFLSRVKYLYQHRGEKSHEEILLDDGRTFERYSAPLFGSERQYYGRIWYFRDMTERKRAEEELRKSESKYKTMINNIPGMIYRACADWSAEIISGSEVICGYTEKELNSKEENWLSIIHYDDKERVFEESSKLAQGQKDLVQTYRIITKSGDIRWVEDRKTSFFPEEGEFKGIDGIVFNITERMQAEEALRSSLKDKEVLLREVHHRVKNNLQAITSLLRLQSTKIKEKQYADILKDSQSRIKSMALVHEKLYHSGDFAEVDFNSYVKALVNSLFRSYGVNPAKIALRVEVDDVSLELDSAIPCGLIINELVSNALKYAFPEDRKGEVRVVLGSTKEDEFMLTVSDNGAGMPEHIDFRNTESLGLHLVTMLAEDQLHGKIELNSVGGTKYHITFKKAGEKARM
jgi:PAS domain S-box-containing protein